MSITFRTNYQTFSLFWQCSLDIRHPCFFLFAFLTFSARFLFKRRYCSKLDLLMIIMSFTWILVSSNDIWMCPCVMTCVIHPSCLYDFNKNYYYFMSSFHLLTKAKIHSPRPFVSKHWPILHHLSAGYLFFFCGCRIFSNSTNGISNMADVKKDTTRVIRRAPRK